MVERIEINLLPAEYRVHKRTLQLQREIIYPVLGFGIISVFLLFWTIKMGNDIGRLKADIFRTEGLINNNKPIKDEIVRMKESKAVVEGKIAALEKINVDRAAWVRIMEMLCQCLPDYTWIVSCEEKDWTLSIQGLTFSFPEVANFMTRLSESCYVKSVDLAGIEQKEGKTFSFSLSCKLNQNLPPVNDGAAGTFNGATVGQKGAR
jgi:Tfp pilus assembly protein PilN